MNFTYYGEWWSDFLYKVYSAMNCYKIIARQERRENRK
jgi:hypothetical protein